VATSQPAIGSPGAVANERNAVLPSALASTKGALVREEACGCGAVSTLTGEAAKFICAKQVLQPDEPPPYAARPTKTVCAEVAATRTGPEFATP
jgi:hypothetical protein